MKFNLNYYDNYIFDNDGVLFDSNNIKRMNISKACSQYITGSQLDNFVDDFIYRSGIPREVKIKEYFSENESIKILDIYNKLNKVALNSAGLTCGATTMIKNIFSMNKNAYVISGGDEDEVKQMLRENKILQYFDSVKGGPNTKYQNYNELQLIGSSVFFGDSMYDYKFAVANNLRFVFISGYTIFKQWEQYFQDKSEVLILKYLSEVYE